MTLRDPSAFVHALWTCRYARHGLECGVTTRGAILVTLGIVGALAAGVAGVAYLQARLNAWVEKP